MCARRLDVRDHAVGHYDVVANVVEKTTGETACWCVDVVKVEGSRTRKKRGVGGEDAPTLGRHLEH